MERGFYNLPKQDCVLSLTYGPIYNKDPSPIFSFLGDDIYSVKPVRVIDEKVCTPNNTFTDCSGNPKFTLPLNDYNLLKTLR